MLRNMDSGIGQARDPDGNLFIDRNGQAFRDILEFLRTNKPVDTTLPPSIVLDEAKYYGIENFKLIEKPKKLALPPAYVQSEYLYPSSADKLHGRMRFYFVEELLTPKMRRKSQSTKSGKTYFMLDDLIQMGFRKCTKRGADDSGGEETTYFQRSVRVAWVDLDLCAVDEELWDEIEIVAQGRVAKVTSITSDP